MQQFEDVQHAMPIVRMRSSAWRHAVSDVMYERRAGSGWRRMLHVPIRFAALLYGGGWAARHASYAYGLQSVRRLPCKVVSIGNLTLGGTGKTPLTQWVARWFQQRGWRVAVLCRGYGARHHTPFKLVSGGEAASLNWREVGDEPYLLAQNLPDIPVLIGKNRFHSGLYACRQFGTQVAILDDGFQHRALHRDLDVVLVDASNPFGHGALLPYGILREPLRALQRADAVVLSRSETPSMPLTDLSCHLQRYAPHKPIYTLATEMIGLHQADSGRSLDLDRLRQQRGVAFSGIGNPDAFRTTLGKLHSDIVAIAVFPDHHPYTADDWQSIVDLAHQYHAKYLLTTEKDAVRLSSDWLPRMPVYVLRVKMRFTSHHPAFEQHLETLIESHGN